MYGSLRLFGRTRPQLAALRGAATSGGDAPVQTALHQFHRDQGGKMVNFGGYSLPVQYRDQSISASHLHTRSAASIFDVSHMLQTLVRGKDALACLESICTADLRGLPDNSGTLTVFTNPEGGILDDLIVTRLAEDSLYIVSNAAMKQADMGIMSAAVAAFSSQGKDVAIEFLTTTDRSLIALQGPLAMRSLGSLLPQGESQLSSLYFMQTQRSEIAGIADCRITRCGYTGEDGFEISVDSAQVRQLTEALLAADSAVKMAGLGARDSLRLEAGLCLYGSDIDAGTTPVEAALNWLIAKRRRSELNFPGAARIAAELATPPARRRIGLTLLDSQQAPPARAGVQIFHGDAQQAVGHITSGCPSPSLGSHIAMGYIGRELSKPGTRVQLKIRDRLYDAQVQRMPFVPTHYYVKPKQ